MESSYGLALKAAGAEVHEFEYFGDYQGEWVARVTFEGQDGWVKGYYGSCSGCDAFEAELGYSLECSDHYETPRDDCKSCQEYQVKLAKFGREYLDDITQLDKLIVEMLESDYIGYDDKAMLKFLATRTERKFLRLKVAERLEKD